MTRSREELLNILPEDRSEAFESFTQEEIDNLARGYADTAQAVADYLPDATIHYTYPDSYKFFGAYWLECHPLTSGPGREGDMPDLECTLFLDTREIIHIAVHTRFGYNQDRQFCEIKMSDGDTWHVCVPYEVLRDQLITRSKK